MAAAAAASRRPRRGEEQRGAAAISSPWEAGQPTPVAVLLSRCLAGGFVSQVTARGGGGGGGGLEPTAQNGGRGGNRGITISTRGEGLERPWVGCCGGSAARPSFGCACVPGLRVQGLALALPVGTPGRFGFLSASSATTPAACLQIR